MKTTRKFYGIFLVLLVSALTFSSCDGLELYWDNGNHYEYSERLCSRTWTDSWYDGYDGTNYYQELRFYGDYTGTDYLESVDRYGNRRTSTLYFNWDWRSYDSLVLDYGNSRSYIDDISWNGWDRMDCVFDGEWVSFTAY